MTSREIVRRTLDYDRPERVARSFGGSDMKWAGSSVKTHATGWQEVGDGRITFWCPVDIQRTLQTGDEQIIRAKAREMLDKLWQGRGGFIAGYYSDNASIGLDPAAQQYGCDEFERCGVRERYEG